jgi:hypothetical protein
MDEELKIDALIDCHEDSIGLWLFIGIVEDNLDISGEELKEATLSIILELLEEGLIQAGFPRERDGFFEQKIGKPKDLVDDIKKKWNELGREPTIFDIIWFYITEKGTKTLMELLMRFFQEHRKLQTE